MPAAYDKYDYPSYWLTREYEYKSEIIALRQLIGKIPHIKNLLDIGSGYGRLIPAYIYRCKKFTLSDPSACLLSLARLKYQKKNPQCRFIHSKLENLPQKIKTGSFDTILLIRVLHHLKNIDATFKTIFNLLPERGYFILEFANKSHIKALCSEFLKGNTTFLLDIFPKDLRKKRNIRRKTLPFLNYHPDIIEKKLTDSGFEIIEKRSVSNFRSSFFKKLFPLELLLKLEKPLQGLLSDYNIGPSIFILCRKRS